MNVTVIDFAGLAVASPDAAWRRTAHEFVHATLREAILDGRISGGSRLVQSDIADGLNVSITPVREALRDLAAEGLIRLDAHRGAAVRELTAGELQELYDLRTLLEPEILRRAWPHLTDEIVEEAARLNDAMDACETVTEWTSLNTRFHHLIFDLCDSPRLMTLHASLTAPWLMYVSAGLLADEDNRQRASEGHSTILEALRRRDLDAAIAESKHHLQITMTALSASI
jgi:DNA-binding GntR family transcriptional regulator